MSARQHALLSLSLASLACASDGASADGDGAKFGAGSITGCVIAGLFVLLSAKFGLFKIELRDLADLNIDARSFWWCWVKLLPLLLVPAWCAGMTFSMMGYGDIVYDKLASVDRDREIAGSWALYKLLLGVGLLTFVGLYVLDFSYWRGCWLKVKHALVSFALACCLLGVVLANHYYPQAAFSVFLLAVPGYVYALRRLFFRGTHVALFTRAFAVAFGMLGVIGAIAWVLWVGGWASSGYFGKPHYWNTNLKVEYASLTCGALDPFDLVSAENRGDGYKHTSSDTARANKCLAAVMLWGSPFMAAMLAVVMSLVANLMSKSFAADSAGDHGKKYGADKQALHAMVRMLAGGFVMMIFVMWVAAGVAGSSMGLANLVMSFAAVGMLLVCVVLAKTVGTSKLMEEAHNVPLIKSMQGVADKNWARGLFVLVAWPAILVYCALSFVNQLVRRYCPCSKDLQDGDADNDAEAGDGDKRLILTLKAHKQIRAIEHWNWSIVLRMVSLWSLAFFVLSVGVGKAVTIFLAWLNKALASTSYGAVVAIFYSIGLFMFLLPPVPGVPVYLAGGVILTNSAWKNGEGPFSFEVAVALSVGICFLIKMNAIVVQQEGFGKKMSDNVKVKKTVGVNSTGIRAIGSILSSRPEQLAFLDIRKVSILCGGPDWPTSVLTGILKLSVKNMLLGSLPVMFLVAPCVMAGAFMLRVGAKWKAVSTVTLLVATVCQLTAGAAAAYFIADVTAKDRKKLEAQPKDQDVLALEVAEEENAKRYAAATTWDKLPTLARLNLILGAVAMIAHFVLCAFMGSTCFRNFTVTSKIDDPYVNPDDPEAQPGLNGRVLNVLKPWGTYAIYLLFYGMFSLYAHGKWVQCCVPDARPLHQAGSGAAPVAMHDIEEQIGELEGGASGSVVKASALRPAEAEA